MGQIWIDIEDAAGNKQGDGPITTALGWSNEPELDLAGRFSFSMPAADPRAALVTEKRIARCWLADADGVREVGAGVIDLIDRDMWAQGGPVLRVSGPDLLHELAYRSVGRLMIREQRWISLKGIGAVRYVRTDVPGDWDRPQAYDDNESTYTDVIVCDAQEWLYIGCDGRFDAMRLVFHTRNYQACALQYQYYRSSGWGDLDVTDGTEVAGVPFRQDGDITWTRPADWERCTPTGASGSWFWVRVRATAGDTDPFKLREVYVLADFPTTDGLAQIMAYAPPGWSLDTVNGYGTTAGEAYMAFNGETVLAALGALAKDRGEHFRLGTGRTVLWLRDDAPLAPVRGIRAGDPMAVEGHDELCLIQSAREHRDASGLMTRIIPYGAGMGGARATLAATSRMAPPGYTLSIADNSIRSDVAEALYGRIERPMQFWNIQSQQGDSYDVHPRMAANELFDAALAALKDYEAPIRSYELSVVKLATRLYPGQTFHAVYQDWRDGVRIVDLDTYRDGTLYIMGVNESVDQDGIFVTGLRLASVRRRPDTDASAVVGAIQDVRGAVANGADGGGTLVLNIKGTTEADTVDLIHASATPMPGMLLALGPEGTFPAEALPPVDLSSAAGPGLMWDGTAFGINAGAGIVINDDALELDLAVDAVWTGNHVFEGGLTAHDILPEAPDTYDLGSSLLPWRTAHISELDAVVFAEETAALVGGWLIVPHDQGVLAADVAVTATTVDFGKAMTTGDFICLRAVGAVEYMLVGTLVAGTTYNVTRDMDGSGANDWSAGTVYLVLGQSGDGRIELNAQDSPRISVLLQGGTYNTQSEFVRIGDLNGAFGISSELYGIGIGDYAGGNYLRYDPSGGFLLRAGEGGVTINDVGITIDVDEDDGLRFSDGAGNYSRIYDNSNLLGSGQGGLGLFSSSPRWGIQESGGAKIAMDGSSGGFLKLQPRSGSNMLVGIGPASDNWWMWQFNANDANHPEWRIAAGSGADPPDQFYFAKSYDDMTYPPRLQPICFVLSTSTTKIIIYSNVTRAAIWLYVWTNTTSAGELTGQLARPDSGTNSITHYNVYVELDSTGRLRVRNGDTSNTKRVLGLIIWH